MLGPEKAARIRPALRLCLLTRFVDGIFKKGGQCPPTGPGNADACFVEKPKPKASPVRRKVKSELREPDGFYATLFLPLLGKEFELRAWLEMDENQKNLPYPTEHQLVVARDDPSLC